MSEFNFEGAQFNNSNLQFGNNNIQIFNYHLNQLEQEIQKSSLDNQKKEELKCLSNDIAIELKGENNKSKINNILEKIKQISLGIAPIVDLAVKIGSLI